jgi:hypothetical protein
MTEQINPLNVGVVGTQPKDKIRVIDPDGYMDAVERGNGEVNDKPLMMLSSYDAEHFTSGAAGEKFNSLNELLAALPELREKYWVVVVITYRE